MKLYKEYCYPDLTTVAEVIKSDPFLFPGEVIDDVVLAGINLQRLRISFVSGATNVVIQPPDCTELGFNKTYLGISFADAQELSWQVAFVLISAFAIKVIKRGF